MWNYFSKIYSTTIVTTTGHNFNHIEILHIFSHIEIVDDEDDERPYETLLPTSDIDDNKV
jgi:hypothetical protein